MTVLLALCAALAFGASVALQERAASAVPLAHALRPSLLARLLRRPVWLLGVGASGLGFALQAAALRHGSLVVVQPVMASSLIFALALVALWTRNRFDPAEWAAITAVVAGVAAFLLLAQPDVDSPARASSGAWWITGGVAAVVAGTPALAALRLAGRRRAANLGLAAGISNGLVAVLTKAFAKDLHQGFGVMGDWPLWALVVAAVPAVLLVQTVYQSGSLSVSMPIIAIVEPVIASLTGVMLFSEHISLDGARSVGVVAATVIAGMGLWRLASDPRFTERSAPDTVATRPSPTALDAQVALWPGRTGRLGSRMIEANDEAQ